MSKVLRWLITYLTFVYSKYIQTKVRWRFRKILWPSQNIWTLLSSFISYIWKFRFSQNLCILLRLTCQICNRAANLTNVFSFTNLISQNFSSLMLWRKFGCCYAFQFFRTVSKKGLQSSVFNLLIEFAAAVDNLTLKFGCSTTSQKS